MASSYFLFAEGFLENFQAWRLLSVEGRLGGGKTILSVALARYLFEIGAVRGVFSNFPIDGDFIPRVESCVGTCVILDEAWSFADARDSGRGYKGYGAMFRKLGSYLISPGVYAADRRMRPVSCERNVDLWLIDMWLYKWADVRGAKGWFLFRGYSELFNVYDHRFIPADDGGILEILKQEIQQLSGSVRVLVPRERACSIYSDPLRRGG